jgi:hypothetical protein
MLGFQYPTWYLILCIFLGVGTAALLYFRDTSFGEKSPLLRRVLGILRALSISIIAALLLSPLLKTQVTDIKKPIVVLAQDVSESIGLAIADSTAYKQRFQALASQIGDKYDVRFLSFGENVREQAAFSFKDKITNTADLMQYVYDQFGNQNLGAVVLATDGIYNEGSNPLYTAAKLNVPIFSIALGDTTPRRDLVLRRVFHNNIVYLGDKFNIQIDVAANNCSGTNSNVTVSRIDGAGNATVASSFSVGIDKSDFFTTKEITLDATQAGVQRFRITASQVSGEVSGVNNTKEIFVEVLDARTKVLLLAHAPHPDISALGAAISTNKNYTITVAYAGDLKVNPADFDFVVLHQLPSAAHGLETVLAALNARRIPRMFVVGGQTDTRKLNAAQSLVSIPSDGKNSNDAQALLNPSFNLFTLDESLRALSSFSPLTTPFGDFKEVGSGQTLLYQRIGKIETKYPLLTLGDAQGIRTSVLAGEGFWKWRLFDFAQHQNHEITNTVVSKVVQYLSVKEDKRKFRVMLDKAVYKENEPVQFGAELYNNAYELVNEPDVSLQITNGEGKQFNYTFSKSGKAYDLKLGILAVGNYRYKAFCTQNGQRLEAEGQFSVQPIQLELYETTANHALLRALSQQLGGSVFMPAQMNAIADSIAAKPTVKPVMYVTNKTQTALNFKWIFALLFLLLGLEWFARRYFGAY